MFKLSFTLCFYLVYNSIVLNVICNKPVNHWSIKRWWYENEDYEHNPINLRFTDSNRRSSHAFINRNHLTNNLKRINPKTNKINAEMRSSVKQIEKTLVNLFSKSRSYRGDRDNYQKIKTRLKQRFIDMGLKTALQSFWPPEMDQFEAGDKAHNIIAVWPGIHRNTNRDQIIIVGAHYDSVPEAPGVDDNGSGSTAVLEIAKLITKSRCQFDKTIMFTLFDLEEDGLKGSKHFVKDYLIPIEIEQNGAQVFGAFILDMVLAYNSANMTQTVDEFQSILPEWSKSIEQNGFRGDFVSVEARTESDARLYKALRKNWQRSDTYKLSIMDVSLPQFANQLRIPKHERFSDFLRSDHVSFWYPTIKNMTISAILINDLGPWRSPMVNQYHTITDDLRSVNKHSLDFLANTIDSVAKTLLDIGNGICI